MQYIENKQQLIQYFLEGSKKKDSWRIGTEHEKFLFDLKNKNSIPYDPQPPAITSGIRIGTPAVTSRGLNEEDMVKLSEVIDLALSSKGNKDVLNRARELSSELCKKHPIY